MEDRTKLRMCMNSGRLRLHTYVVRVVGVSEPLGWATSDQGASVGEKTLNFLLRGMEDEGYVNKYI